MVGITGSVGKTSVKEAVTAVLSSKFNVRSNHKNYNNEIGLPLTIIGFEQSPGRSVLGWLLVFGRAFICSWLKIKIIPKFWRWRWAPINPAIFIIWWISRPVGGSFNFYFARPHRIF